MVKLSPLAHKSDAHADAVWCCAWTSDGETLITGSVDEAVVKWEARPVRWCWCVNVVWCGEVAGGGVARWCLRRWCNG